MFRKVLSKLRKCILKFANPLICLEYKGHKLKMPFSHPIFLFQQQYPNYDIQLHKIATYIKAKQGFLNMVDVGANIGDTVVFTNIKEANYLLIEGERSYANLIEENIALNYAGGGGLILF